MKIAILGSRGIPAQYGGFETFAEELSTRLAARGVDVTVYCEDHGGERPAAYKNVELVHLPAPNLGPLTTILFDLRCLWRGRKGFDVVFMLGYGASLFCFLPRLWGAKVWINMDGIEWARSKWGTTAKLYFKVMEAIAMRVADRLIVDAEEIRRFLLERHPVRTPCTVIPYGAEIVDDAPEPGVLREYDLRPHEYYLIVCRLEPENQILEVLNGFRASGSSVPLVVIGDHRLDTAYLRRLKTAHGDRARFIGTLYDREKLRALRYYCKGYFHGHTVGGTNPSLLEALGCGNMVIAHDNIFNREVAGEAAVYFKDSADLPGLIEKHTQENEQRAGASLLARKRIRDRYTWDSVADRYFRILNG
jgi:glycosyltransferase involved in cell wall biosynthesis